MSESTTSSLNPMAREFTPSPVEKSEHALTMDADPFWLSNAPQSAGSYQPNAEVFFLKPLYEQEQAYYPEPLPSGPGFVAPAMPAPALLEATHPLFFEAALRDAWSQANMMAKHGAYVTGDTMMAKLASASAALLQSSGYVRTNSQRVLKYEY